MKWRIALLHPLQNGILAYTGWTRQDDQQQFRSEYVEQRDESSKPYFNRNIPA